MFTTQSSTTCEDPAPSAGVRTYENDCSSPPAPMQLRSVGSRL